MLLLWPLLVAAIVTTEPLPDLVVTRDNTVIDHSCRIVIAPDAIIPDVDGDGVLHISADGIVVEFAPGSTLIGAPPMPEVSDDRLSGVGVRIDGHTGVKLRNLRIQGYKAAIHASRADDLTIDSAEIIRNFRQRLKSTPLAEDAADWLWPHKNDDREWLSNYGTAVYLETSRNVTVRAVRVRGSQNGLVLDHVTDSRIYDCDASFLSGWGLALWRSSGNYISRNAFDFCIRGYSHGVYNRGQDSAGILCFEQSSSNRFYENSATHCGDGFFGFAGNQALGEHPAPDNFDYTDRGCNANTLLGNDFSFAAAHGVELTFSFDNTIRGNRLVGNAICGVWGGYSQRTNIVDNVIEDNGDPAAGPGREGGGINIEHGYRNRIVGNRFARNSVAVSLWSDGDAALMQTPWAKANHHGSTENTVTDNTFKDEPSFLTLRGTPITTVGRNTFANTPESPVADESSRIEAAPESDGSLMAATVIRPLGEARPIGARAALDGRDKIVMGPWGPWDGQSPMMRLTESGSGRMIHALYGEIGAVTIDVIEGRGDLETNLGDVDPELPRALSLQPRTGVQVLPYRVRIRARGIDEVLSGTLINTTWTGTIFKFTHDPRKDLDAWRREAVDAGVPFACENLAWMRELARGPDKLPMFREALASGRVPGRESFGIIARTTLTLAPGSWRFSTLSDDGVRVRVGKQAIIENWTHHAPARDSAVFTQTLHEPVEIVVEYFQLDGHATFDLSIEKVETPAPSTATP